MPIGGSAYYEKLKKNLGAKTQPVSASVQAPSVKKKILAKSVGSSDWVSRPAKKMRSAFGSATLKADPSALDDVVAQILNLAQRVHAVAGQAEAAILRAEAAVMKAEVAVGKAEAAASRADGAFSKSDVAVSRAEAAAFKSESSAKRAELSASKAGLAAGKSELASVGRDMANVVSEVSSLTAPVPDGTQDIAEAAGEEDNRTKELNGPISQIAVMSMKLRSGMRQIEEDREKSGERSTYLRPSPNLNIAVGRENLASGLVSLDSDTSLPRVAPFIMDAVSNSSPPGDNGNKEETETESLPKPPRNGVSSAA